MPAFIRLSCILAGLAFICLAHAIESAPAEDPAEAPASQKKLPSRLEPSPAPAIPAGPKRSPDEIVGTFFDALKADRVDAAYDSLKTELAMADRAGNEATAMREQTQKALDSYGPVLGSEMVLEEKLGTHLLRRTYVLVGEVLPLRWKFYFYKPADRWFLIDMRIDDGIPAWFDEAAKAAK